MEIIDNINHLLGENLKRTIKSNSKLKIAASTSAAFEDADEDDENFPMPDDSSIGNKVQISLADMDLPSWQHDLNADLFVIDGLLHEMHKIQPEDDYKLQHLKNQIHGKLVNPINPGNKKVLVFTAFADTAIPVSQEYGCAV